MAKTAAKSKPLTAFDILSAAEPPRAAGMCVLAGDDGFLAHEACRALATAAAGEGWGADTVLLEKAELTSGSTWHAAGQITHSTSSFGLGKCVD